MIGATVLVYSIISLFIMFGLSYRLSESFGGGLGFALGLTVAPVVFYPLLAFVRSQEMRRKRLNQMISSTVTAALVFSVVTCAPFGDTLQLTNKAADIYFGV